MLSAFVIAAAYLAQTEAKPSQPPSLPDHRTQFVIYPVRSTNTTEWVCHGNDQPSRAALSVTDVGIGVRNETYKSELSIIEVAGRSLAPELEKRITAAIGELTTVPELKGQCLGRSPVLSIAGFSRVGSNYVPRKFEFTLK
jgi:hypothetical protein